MAYKPTNQQKLEFIAEIAPLAQKAYKTLGKVLPSVCIGMACLESGFGHGTDGSRFMYKHNAVLGQKVGRGKTALKYWSGKFFTTKTSEEYTIGVHTVIQAAFRKYDTLEQCIFNYYELLNTSLYKKVLAGCDYATQMEQIKKCGYMTSSTEVDSVKIIIQEFNLTAYDLGIPTTPIPTVEENYIVGKVYTLQTDLYIREQPFGEKMKFSCITENAQQHSRFDDYGCAILKKGTRVTCKAVSNQSKSVWILIPSGWVCANEAGKAYIN